MPLLHHSIGRAADADPFRDAFRCRGASIRYGDFDAQTNRLANLLLEIGVRPGDRVGIFLNKSLEMPVSVYGILKAGAAYVPIDPMAPAARIAFLVKDCGIRALISHPAKRRQVEAMIREGAPLDWVVGCPLEPDERGIHSLPWSAVDTQNATSPQVTGRDHDSLAYVMYTSGSTGVPKGLKHTHRSGSAYARYASETYGVVSTDRLGNHAPLHFDISTFEFLAGPLCGATSVLIPEETLLFPVSLAELISNERLTFWYSVPLALLQLLQSGQMKSRDFESLRWVLFGGEPFAPKHLRNLMDLLPRARFSNVYGPAEVNQCTYYHAPSDFSSERATIPIGRIWNGANGLIVNERDEIAPDGETGELLIASDTMMEGYWNRPDLDSHAFQERIDRNGAARRYYRTGDLVSIDADGQMIFLGRKDRQVKVRGYRVELDEVEAVFASFPETLEAAAVVVPGKDDANEIIVALALRSGERQAISEILRASRARLPAYAVPSRIDIRTEAFPRTSSGKIDRKRLAEEYGSAPKPSRLEKS